MLLQATAGAAALLQDVRTVHHYSVSVRGGAVAAWPGREGGACGHRLELASSEAGGARGASLCPQPRALSRLLHVDICVSCEFSATSWPGAGEVAGEGLWPLWEQPGLGQC